MSDTELEMELLQKYLFIPLDIFQERQQKYNDDLAESLKNTIDILRSLELSEEEIITRICDKYHMQAEQVTRYL